MKTVIQWLLIAGLGLLLAACSNHERQLHESSNSSLPKNIGIQGYSLVSYFETKRAERGNPAFSYEYKKRLYYFTSQAQLKTFKQSPDAFAPKFGEYCPYSLALGRRVTIDPTNFKIHDGELLLFHSDIELATVDVIRQQDTFDKAEQKFKLFEF